MGYTRTGYPYRSIRRVTKRPIALEFVSTQRRTTAIVNMVNSHPKMTSDKKMSAENHAIEGHEEQARR